MAKWSHLITTDTVNTPKGVMTLSSSRMVRVLLQENPDLPIGAIIRWIVFYVNRAGKSLPEHRRVICHAAIRKLQRLNRSLQSRNRS